MTNAAGFTPIKDDVFGRIAKRYDKLCDVFSFGLHRYWKAEMVKVISAEPWQDLLDVASGTGDIVYRLLQHTPPQNPCNVLVTDISVAMLSVAQQKLSDAQHLSLHKSMLHSKHQKHHLPISDNTTSMRFMVLDAEQMSAIADNSQDVVSISLAMKICQRDAVLKEAHRVLRPNGRLVILEASNIPIAVIHRAYLCYMAIVVPIIGWLATGGEKSAYRYLLQGVRDFVSAEVLAQEMHHQGFTSITFKRLSGGIMALHQGYKA